MIRVTRSGVVCGAPQRELLALRDEARRRDVVILPDLLESTILAALQRELAESRFVKKLDISSNRLVYSSPIWDMKLCFLLQDVRFFDAVSFVMDAPPLRLLYGRLVRKAVEGDADRWHSDSRDGVAASLSIAVGTPHYQGGALELRRRGSPRLAASASHRQPGDGLLFRISPELLHRSAPLEGDNAKTIFIAFFAAAAGRRFQDPWCQTGAAASY